LKQLTPPLKAFIDFFEIDPFLVSAAAERSPNMSSGQQVDFTPLISRLTRQESEEFLLKIVNAEPGAVAALRKRLLSFGKAMTDVPTNPRTFGELLKMAERLRKAESKRRAEVKRRKHIAEMQELAKREDQTWQNVDNLIQSGYAASNYDEATSLLVKLEQLAEFQNSMNNFETQVQSLAEKYKGRGARIARWKKKGWV
jgi:hypothetical protein